MLVRKEKNKNENPYFGFAAYNNFENTKKKFLIVLLRECLKNLLTLSA